MTSDDVPESVDAYMRDLSDFARPMAERLRHIIRATAPDLEEKIRWSCPTYKGTALLCAFHCSKRHVSLMMHRGAEIDDPKGLLIHGQGRSSNRTAQFTSVDQVEDKMIRGWIRAALKLDQQGPAPKAAPVKRPAPTVPEALRRAFAQQKNAAARTVFEAMPPSHRREYCEWIEEAKQEATVQRRVKKALEKLHAGEGLHDKYRP